MNDKSFCFLSAAAGVVLCLALSNCSKPQPTFAIAGQVFIVIKSGESIKLGLVEISVIPEAAIARFIELKKAGEEAMRASLQQQLEEAMKTTKAINEECSRLGEAVRLATDVYTAAPSDSKWRKGKTLNGQWHAKCDDLKPTAMALAKADAILNYFPTADYYFDGLPGDILKTTTDADGRFSLVLPSGKFAIAARASRELYQSREDYFWLIWVSPEKIKTLMLSNNNLMDAPSADAVVTVKALSLHVVLQEREKSADEMFEREAARAQLQK